ncbi:lysozyme inhibitor LprI family protein, partial [Clostridium baratii]|uniref:lysozyme inhibitor LprI family protein n=1 Tax=Clostridium baratii TaxID=1561 RepID=UPI002A7586C2
DNIEGLREKINEGLKTNKDIDSSISKARDLIENKKYEEAKKVLDKINSSDLKENQKQTIDDLKGRVDSEIKNKEQSKKESLATERIKFLNELNDIQKDINEMPAGDTTAEMHEFADNEYKLWDNALNKIYRYLKNNLPQDKFKALDQDEVRWIKEKEAKAKDAADKFKGGTAEPVVYLGALADETKDRCYKLVNEYMN